jgi:Tfp pilus assembly PilM family ATPase
VAEQLLDEPVSLLIDAGLHPSAIDVDAFALHNAVEHNDPEGMEGIVAAADEIGMGIERASTFLMAQRAGAGLGRIYLSGGGALIPGMPEAIAGRMGVETLVVNPFERVPIRRCFGRRCVGPRTQQAQRDPRTLPIV